MEKNLYHKIWFCRHAQSLRNQRHELWAQNNNGGKDPNLEYTDDMKYLDAELSSKGKEQARSLGTFLIENKIRIVFVSPLMRSVQTLFFAIEEIKDQSLIEKVMMVPDLIEQAGHPSNMPFRLEETKKIMEGIDYSEMEKQDSLFFIEYLEEMFVEEFKTAFNSEDILVLHDLIRIYGRDVETKASRHKRARNCLKWVKNWIEIQNVQNTEKIKDGEVLVIGHGNWWRACQMSDIEDYSDYPKKAPKNCLPFLIKIPYKAENEDSDSDTE